MAVSMIVSAFFFTLAQKSPAVSAHTVGAFVASAFTVAAGRSPALWAFPLNHFAAFFLKQSQ